MTDVGALIVSDGKYVLQERDAAPGIRWPGRLGLFGGGVDPGESPESAMRRELAEELEFHPNGLMWWDKFPDLVIFVFNCSAAEVANFKLHEGRAIRVMTADEALADSRLIPIVAQLIRDHRNG